MPPIRCVAQTDLDEKGMGLGVLAGGSAQRVAVLAWNYQWRNSTAKDFSLRLDNLPPAFRQNNIQVKLYAVRLGKTQGDAELEVDEEIVPAEAYSRRLHLKPNEFVLLELTTN